MKLTINSSDEFDPGDWIEVYNPNQENIDLSGWVLKDDNDSNEIYFSTKYFI